MVSSYPLCKQILEAAKTCAAIWAVLLASVIHKIYRQGFHQAEGFSNLFFPHQ